MTRTSFSILKPLRLHRRPSFLTSLYTSIRIERILLLMAIGISKKNIDQYIDDRNKRVSITIDAVRNESDIVKEWSLVHIIIYYNELLGRVALYPEFHSDVRIKTILKFIKQNKSILNKYYSICGFSNIGRLLIIHLPTILYMKYRKYKY